METGVSSGYGKYRSRRRHVHVGFHHRANVNTGYSRYSDIQSVLTLSGSIVLIDNDASKRAREHASCHSEMDQNLLRRAN